MNLYEILGLDITATVPQIKAAYRRLSMKYHPDKVTGMENKFQELSHAYQVLTNPDRKARYDRTGRYDDVEVTPQVVQGMVEQAVLAMIHTERPDGTTDDPSWENVKQRLLTTVKDARREIQLSLNRQRKKLARLDNLAKRFKSKTDADPCG